MSLILLTEGAHSSRGVHYFVSKARVAVLTRVWNDYASQFEGYHRLSTATKTPFCSVSSERCRCLADQSWGSSSGAVAEAPVNEGAIGGRGGRGGCVGGGYGGTG